MSHHRHCTPDPMVKWSEQFRVLNPCSLSRSAMVRILLWSSSTTAPPLASDLFLQQSRGRKLRTFIPALPQSLEPMFPTQAHKKLLKQRQQEQNKYGDCHTQALSALARDQPVWLRHKNTWQKAVVTQVGPEPRRYTVQTRSGGVYVRNRYHLRPRTPRAEDDGCSAEEYFPDEPRPTT
ncbi:unnamed protein product, partial [Ixodes pacificus]